MTYWDAMGIGFVIGLIVGLFIGYFRGWTSRGELEDGIRAKETVLAELKAAIQADQQKAI